MSFPIHARGARRRAGLLLLLLAAAILPAFGCDDERDAMQTTEDFLAYYAAGDFESAYALLAPSSPQKQAHWTRDYFARAARLSYGGPYDPGDFDIKPLGHAGEEVSYSATATLDPTDGSEPMVIGCEISLVGEDGAWLVSYFDWVAVPAGEVEAAA